VFCCFNNSYKITPDLFDVWMRLLRAIDGGVLWLSTGNATAPINLRREAEKRGVAGERLVFAPKVPRNEDHLARVGLADLFIDTLYYNAHATAADALWAGVPVLTQAGAAFPGRVAASLLQAAALPDLVTESAEAFERLAVTLATDPAALAAVKKRLTRRCPLFDTDFFRRQIEAAYEKMWQTWLAGKPPAGFGPITSGREP
jgi:predicted O-linked N-acetylglucosamine transferase (SPINDLY family)